MIAVPLIGLMFGLLLILVSIGSLIANPLRLGVAALGVVEVGTVLVVMTPRIIGQNLAKAVIDTVFGR